MKETEKAPILALGWIAGINEEPGGAENGREARSEHKLLSPLSQGTRRLLCLCHQAKPHPERSGLGLGHVSTSKM